MPICIRVWLISRTSNRLYMSFFWSLVRTECISVSVSLSCSWNTTYEILYLSTRRTITNIMCNIIILLKLFSRHIAFLSQPPLTFRPLSFFQGFNSTLTGPHDKMRLFTSALKVYYDKLYRSQQCYQIRYCKCSRCGNSYLACADSLSATQTHTQTVTHTNTDWLIDR